MKVQVYAVLKDHFAKEFEVQADMPDAAALKQYLIRQNPAAANILNICRFAVNDEFVDNDFQLNEHDTIAILPPASGG